MEDEELTQELAQVADQQNLHFAEPNPYVSQTIIEENPYETASTTSQENIEYEIEIGNVSIDGVQRCANTVTMCRLVGMDSPEERARIESEVREIRDDWPNLTVSERRSRVSGFIDGMRERAGIPEPINVRYLEDENFTSGAVGLMNLWTWTFTGNGELLHKRYPTEGEFDEFFLTAAHEARHAEQAWLVARRMAGSEHSAQQIAYLSRDPKGNRVAEIVGINRGIAHAAVQSPMTEDDPAAGCADELWDAYTATDERGIRNQHLVYRDRARTNRQLSRAQRRFDDMQADYDRQVWSLADTTDGTPQAERALRRADQAEDRLENAKESLNEAREAYQNAREAYRCLDAEADAFQFENSLNL